MRFCLFGNLPVAPGHGALRGDLSEDHDIRHGVAADAVAAVDAAGDLTGPPKPLASAA